jgi:hypothetical protein
LLREDRAHLQSATGPLAGMNLRGRRWASLEVRILWCVGATAGFRSSPLDGLSPRTGGQVTVNHTCSHTEAHFNLPVRAALVDFVVWRGFFFKRPGPILIEIASKIGVDVPPSAANPE